MSWVITFGIALAMLLLAIGFVAYLLMLDAFPPERTEG